MVGGERLTDIPCGGKRGLTQSVAAVRRSVERRDEGASGRRGLDARGLSQSLFQLAVLSQGSLPLTDCDQQADQAMVRLLAPAISDQRLTGVSESPRAVALLFPLIHQRTQRLLEL